jgi:iron complex transport system substrate-binding protein
MMPCAARSLRLLAATGLFACSLQAASAIEIETATGREHVADAPKTVAVFDIPAVDTLDRLGIKPAGVPNNIYLPELRKAAEGAEVVGTLFEPDLEALSALAPDLVIIGGRSQPKLAAVRQVAPAIDMTIGSDDLVGDALKRLETYGALFAKEEEAAKVRGELEAALAKTRAAAAGKGRALIVMTNGTKISAYGPGSRFGWVHSSLGLEPAAKGMAKSIHGEVVSFEFIAKVDPDWLIVVDRAAAIGAGDQSAKVTLDNELVAGTKAWRNKQVVYVPAGDFYIAAGGVQALMRTLDVLETAFRDK